MADNVELNPGTGGRVIAADDIGPGVWHQRVKVQHGADGTATDVSTASPLPVVDTRTNTSYHLVAAATTNAQSVKGSAGVVRGVTIYNNATYPVYLKFHNTASAPTPGSGVYRTIGCQAGVPVSYEPPGGINFATGIGITITKLLADADTTAVAAGDCVIGIEYQ